MALLEAQIRASISSATSMFATAPPTVPPAVAAGVAAAGGGTSAVNGGVPSLPKKAQDHTLRWGSLMTHARMVFVWQRRGGCSCRFCFAVVCFAEGSRWALLWRCAM